MLIINLYHNSLKKRLFDLFISSALFIIFLPLLLLVALLIKLTSDGKVFFIQKRVGKNGKTFKMFKFRTMVKNADKLKKNYKKLNEADGPVFKIKDDPRFTKIGKILSRTALDELPQVLNVIIGNMSLVGPRPLPLDEARKLNKSQVIRNRVKPGLTSSWVVNGSHRLSFKEWMNLDKSYVLEGTLKHDILILLSTFHLVFKYVVQIIKRQY